MTALLAFVLAFAQQEGELDQLILKLGSDAPEIRDAAQRRLIELCPKSRAAVERATKNGNPEISERAKAILRSTEFRLQNLFEAGFRRETATSIPNFAPRFWSSVPAERATAIRDLAEHGSHENLLAVTSVLRDEELPDAIRVACLDLTEKLKTPELAPLIIPLLRPQTSPYRIRVIEVLASAGAKDAGSEILPLLEERDSAVIAANSLKKLGIPLPEDSVRRMLKSQEDLVRTVAVSELQARRWKGFNTEIVDILCREKSVNAWLFQDTLGRTGATWDDLKRLISAPHGPARLIGLRLAISGRLKEALEAALLLLDDEDDEVRPEAMDFVISWGGPDVIKALLGKNSPQALLALARLGVSDSKGKAEKALKSASSRQRQAAISALRALDTHDRANDILPLLNDPIPGVRLEAARVLPHLGGDAVGPPVAARLAKETDPKVIAQLLDAIAETGYREAGALVLRFLRDGGREIGPAAVRAAGAIQLEEAAPLLVQGYVEGKPEGLGGAYEALLQSRPAKLVELLRPYLKPVKKDPAAEEDPPGLIIHRIYPSRESKVQEAAHYLLYVDPPGAKELFLEALKNGIIPTYPVESVRFFGAEEAFPQLISELESPSGRWNHGAGRLLAAYGRRDLVDSALVWLIKGDRDNALEFLQRIMPEDKVPALVAKLDDPDPSVREKASTALCWIGGQKVVEEFQRRTTSGSALDRALAGQILANMGDRTCIPKLEALLEDNDPQVRVEAAYGLNFLESKSSFDRLVKAYKRGIGKDDWVWPYAFARLGGAKGRAMVRPLFEAAEDVNVRRSLFSALGQGGDYTAEEVAYVESLLSDRDLATDGWSAFARMAPDRATALLSNSRYRRALVRGGWYVSVLQSVKTPEATAAYVSMLTDPEASVRGGAAIELGKRRDPSTLEPLAKTLHDEVSSVRRYAALALAQMGDSRGLDEILRLPRSTTVSQGRMSGDLLALNFIRQPEACKKLAGIRWEGFVPVDWKLGNALEDLAKQSGMKVTRSPMIAAEAWRFPLDWQGRDLDGLSISTQSPWDRFVSFVIDSEEIRVLTPDEALHFWREWAKSR